jgi:deoxyribonuclease-4
MINFGVAGYPPAFNQSKYRRDRMAISQWISEIGLDAFEMQMTYGPRTTAENCVEHRRLAEQADIKISVHASYFIVFTSDDATKIAQSNDTLKRTYDAANLLGATTVVLHPGPLYGASGRDPLDRFIENAGRCLDEIGKTDIGLFVETAGKIGQLGSVDEILEICRHLDGTFPCVDFGHVHARTLGSLEEPKAIDSLVDQLVSFIESRNNPRIHFHYTPIHFGPRGEIQHRAIDDRYVPLPQRNMFGLHGPGEASGDGFYHPRVDPVGRALQRIPIDCTVISETHDSQETGAMALKQAFLAEAQAPDKLENQRKSRKTVRA